LTGAGTARLYRVVLAITLVLVPVTARAQIAPPAPPGPYVIDLHVALAGVPTNPGFYPEVPAGTVVPARGFGVAGGAHVYFGRLGAARLGIGASVMRARATASPPEPESDSRTSTPPPRPGPTAPDTEATLTALTPQLSFNFGSAAGWSYLSAGIGRLQLVTHASAFREDDDEESDVTAEQTLDFGARTSLNFGGGARWFTRSRLAYSFDVRFHMLGAQPGTTPRAGSGAVAATPRSFLIVAGAGISLR
jgi:hypothetical protein